MIRLPKILVTTLGSDDATNWCLWSVRLGLMACAMSAVASFIMLGTDPSTNPFIPLFRQWAGLAVLVWVLAEVLAFIDRRRQSNDRDGVVRDQDDTL